MGYKTVFNATVCIVGILFLLIHALNVGLKKNKRKDDLIFLGFVLLTAILFVLYLIYTIISFHYKEDSIVMVSNTIFYIISNLSAHFNHFRQFSKILLIIQRPLSTGGI